MSSSPLPKELRITSDGITLDEQTLLASGDHPIHVRLRSDVEGLDYVTLTLLVESVTVIEDRRVHAEPTEDGILVHYT